MRIFTCNIERRRQRSAEGEDAGNRYSGGSKGGGEGTRRTGRGTPLPPQMQIKAGGGEGQRKLRKHPLERQAYLPPTPRAPVALVPRWGLSLPLQNQATLKDWLCFASWPGFHCEQVLWISDSLLSPQPSLSLAYQGLTFPERRLSPGKGNTWSFKMWGLYQTSCTQIRHLGDIGSC